MAIGLIRLQLALLRRGLRSHQAPWIWTGTALGVALALLTLWIAFLPAAPGVRGDLLALSGAVWTLGWIFWPSVSGSSALNPQHFALLPLTVRQLSAGLTAALFVGFAPAFTALAYAASVVSALRIGAAPGVAALLGWPLQLALTLLLARIALALLLNALRSRLGAVCGALMWGLLMSAAAQGWAAVLAVGQSELLVRGLSAPTSLLVRVLPSGWNVAAAEAAGRGEWGLCLLALTGLALLNLLLLGIWNWLVGQQLQAQQLSAPVVGGRWWRFGAAHFGPVVARELVAWLRLPARLYILGFALGYALGFCLLPLLVGLDVLLPWTGAAFVIMACTFSTNLLGGDGSALWLNVLAPGSARPDVQGRLIAWLLVVTPVAALLGSAGVMIAGQAALWPWVLGSLASWVGGGAGLVVYLSVRFPSGVAAAVRRDPARGLGGGERAGMMYLSLLLVGLCGLPAVLMSWWGTTLGGGWVWLGVPGGLASGALIGRGLSEAAVSWMEPNLPELLQRVRGVGSAPALKTTGAERVVALQAHEYLILLLGIVALFPQGLVPAVFKLTGVTARAWFLALYLPTAWQWPMILLMFLIGALCYFIVKRRLNKAQMTASRLRRDA